MRIGNHNRTEAINKERAVSRASGFVEKQQNAKKTVATQKNSARAIGSGALEDYAQYGTSSYLYKTLKTQEYNQELEDARINHPEKYQKMLEEREQSIAKSFSQVEANALKNGGYTTYNGVGIHFKVYDDQHKIMSVGDISQGDVITVGPLSSGYVLKFNMDNVDSIPHLFELFSPDDINKILEAIIMHKMEKEAELDMESEESGSVKSAKEEGTEDIRKAEGAKESMKKDNTDSEEESNIESEIVENADGSRNLVITTKIGDQEVITKIPLNPTREHNPYHVEKGNQEYEKQFMFALH